MDKKGLAARLTLICLAAILLSLTACKDIIPDPQKKIVVNNIDSKYNGRTAELKLRQATVQGGASFTEKAHASSPIGGGQARFELLDETDNPLTGNNGVYTIILSISPATLSAATTPEDLLPWLGTKAMHPILGETTTLSFSEFDLTTGSLPLNMGIAE